MRIAKRWFAVLLTAFVLTSLLLVSFLSAGCGSPAAEEEEEEKVLKFGHLVSLTGGYSNVQLGLLQAPRDYYRYINEEEGGINGVKVEAVWADSGTNKVPMILSGYERFKEEGVMCFSTSSVMDEETIKAKLEPDGMICAGGSGPAVAVKVPGWMYAPIGSYADNCQALLDYWMSEWEGSEPPKLAFLTMDNPGGKSALIPDYAESIGYEVVATELVPTIPVDTTPSLSRIKELEVDFVTGCIVLATAVPLWKDMNRLGIDRTETKFGWAWPLSMEDALRETPDLAEGIYFGRHAASWYDDDVAGVKFMKDLQNKYHPEKQVFGWIYQAGFVISKTFVEAARLALDEVPFEELTPTKFRDHGITKIEGLSSDGIYAPITFSGGAVQGLRAGAIYKIENGEGVRIGEWWPYNNPLNLDLGWE